MKVQTLESLKVGSNEILPAGVVFSDADGEIPHYILDLVNTHSKAILILENDPPKKVVPPKKARKPAVTAKSSKEKSIPTETARPKPTPKPKARRRTKPTSGD